MEMRKMPSFQMERGRRMTLTTLTYDDLAEFYRMGYFRGRADAADRLPYDARLPHERPEPPVSDPPSSASPPPPEP